MIRLPAVSGRFYPADPEKLTEELRSFIHPDREPVRAIGIIVPHAGYIYSGHVAGAVYSRIQIPARNVVLCPNHTGLGAPIAIMKAGAWQTPLGQLQIDGELCDALLSADPYLEDDFLAHRSEHGLEVQLPFIQYIGGSTMTFAPITVGTGDWRRLENLGIALAAAIKAIDQRILIIASSDMNHYESDAVTRVKDRKAIDQVLSMNPRGLFDVVQHEGISMCGYGPAVAMMVAAKILGASRAELVKYATSGDVSGDSDYVVGYAGIVID